MKRMFSLFILAACIFAAAEAQTSFAGRVYQHPNIMIDGMKAHAKEIEGKMDEAIREEIAKEEKKKGRALTAEERTKVEKELEEARQTSMAVMKCMKTTVTATFKTDKELEMQMKIQLDEEGLKNAGISWAKRKALKAGTALMPTSQKMKYTVQGNLIICTDGKDKDTLTVSNDGKYLYGEMDEKTKFKLTRIK